MNRRILRALILLALVLVGPSAQAKDVIVQVNGYSVRLDIVSPARPHAAGATIVFESGLGTPGTGDYGRVLPLLPSDLRTVFAPLGLGRKERDEMRALDKPNPAPLGAPVAHRAAVRAPTSRRR